jgi:acetyl-CoA carboxylase biotin carboxylase subunit
MRAERALDEFVVEGIKTTIPLQQRLLKNEDVRKLKFDNHWLEKYLSEKHEEEKTDEDTTDEEDEEDD